MDPLLNLKQADEELCMRIIAFGDVHMDLGNFKDIPQIAAADLILITGDFTNYGNQQQARRIIDTIREVNETILALPGNLDNIDVADYLTAQGISLHGAGKTLDNIGIFGVGGSNITPFQTPIEFTEEELAALLESGHGQTKGAKHRILVTHPPPFNTNTDRITSGDHVGSVSVRAFIEKHQPALCLCGHIHESRGEDRIGKTLVINPGMIKDGGWIEVFLENDRLRAVLQFCSEY